MPSWKKVLISGSDAALNTLIVTNGITGSLFGTASYATQALSASWAPAPTDAFIQNGNSFGTTALLGTNDNQSLALETNGTTNMFISSSGNVGIGKITPNVKLDVNGNTTVTGSLRVAGTIITTQDILVNGIDVGRGNSNTSVLVGNGALQNNTGGSNNVAIGYQAVFTSSNASGLVAIGSNALRLNTVGSANTAVGTNTLQANTTGNNNTAIGREALTSSSLGFNNTANGRSALFQNNTGNNNSAIGAFALANNVLGSGNIAIGVSASLSTTGNSNIVIGFSADTLAAANNNSIVIGSGSVGLGSNTTVIGNSSTTATAIYGDLLVGQTVDNGVDKLQVTGTSNLNGNTRVTGSLTVTNGITGSLFGTASWALNTATASYVNPLVQNVVITGSLLVSGSTTQIGNNNLQGTTTLSGSINISGNTTITGSLTALNLTASFGYVSASFLDITGKQTVRGFTQYIPTSDVVPIATVGGYIYASGSQGDLYFGQTNGSLVNTVKLRWLEGNMYSGLLNGGVIASSSSTVYTVSSGSGLIVSMNGSLSAEPYPTVQYINWGNLSASIAPLSASYDQQYVAIDSSGQIYAQGTPFYDGEFNTLINIGLVLHSNHSTINGVKTQPSLAYGTQQDYNLFSRAFGPLKLSGFTVAVSGSSTGSIVLGSGTSYAPGANYIIDPSNPSYITDPGTNTSKMWRYYDSSSYTEWVYDTNGGAGYPTLDPTLYNPGGSGSLATVGASNYSLQRVFWFPNSVSKAFVVYYGNARYGNLDDAVLNLNVESFVEAPNTAANAVYLGTYAIKGGTNTSLQNPLHFKWIPGGLFRNVGGNGGGGSVVTQTLSGLSDVSIVGPTNGQPLVYNSTTLKWENNSIITGSLFGTASYATQALTSSFATTASFLNGGTNGFIQNGNSFGTTATLGTNDNQSLALETSGSTRMFISSSGNVGIGETSPSARLHIASASAAPTIKVGRAVGNSSILSTDPTGYLALDSNGAATIINHYTANNVWLATGGGIVGIGTTNPGYKLDVRGTILSSGSFGSRGVEDAYRLKFYDNGGTANDAGIGLDGSAGAEEMWFNSLGGFQWYLGTNGEKMRITSAGNVGIGTTLPSASLHVQGTVMISQSLFQYSNNAAIVSGSTANIASFPTSSYMAGFFDFVASSGLNARAGTVFTVWNGTSLEYVETSTNDIGVTTNLILSASLSGSNVRLQGTSLSGSWNVKTLTRMI